MSDYIKREDAEKAILDCPISGMLDLINLQTAISNIDAIPSADVVKNQRISPITTKTEGHLEYAPIVRCKDCKGYTPADETYGTCYAYKGVYGKIKPTDYCSYGERKKDE